jgi:hypothetical protein
MIAWLAVFFFLRTDILHSFDIDFWYRDRIGVDKPSFHKAIGQAEVARLSYAATAQQKQMSAQHDLA